MNWKETLTRYINNIPQQPQVQYSLMEQLEQLRLAANKLGLYDAADYLKFDKKQENNYIPEPGDMFMWCDEKYWCIESNSFSGRVVNVGDTNIENGFIWDFGGEKQIFIRKATEDELLDIFNIQ